MDTTISHCRRIWVPKVTIGRYLQGESQMKDYSWHNSGMDVMQSDIYWTVVMNYSWCHGYSLKGGNHEIFTICLKK